MDLGYLRLEDLIAQAPGARRPATAGVSQVLGAILTPAPVSTLQTGQAPRRALSPCLIFILIHYIFALTGEGKRWVFVDFLLGMIRFLKMDFCVRENGDSRGISCFI